MSLNNYRMQYPVKCCYNCGSMDRVDGVAFGDCSQMPRLQKTVCSAAICDLWIKREDYELPSDTTETMISTEKVPLDGE